MNSGHFIEEGIAQMAFYHMPELMTIQPDNGIRIDDKQPYLSSTLDRWGTAMVDGQLCKYVLDCKSVGVSSYKTLKQTSIPSYAYWLQIQQQLLVSEHSINAKIGYLASWAGGQMLKVYRITPSEAAHKVIRRAGQLFYECIVAKEEPADELFSFVDPFLFVIDEEIKATSNVAFVAE